MSIVAVRRALEGALNGMTPALSTAWENAKFSPVTGTPYQTAHLMSAEPDNPVYGDEYVEQGIFQITLYYPEGNGPAAAMTRAELIRDTFYRGATFTNGGISVIIQRTPEIAPGDSESGRYVLIVRVRYFANVFT